MTPEEDKFKSEDMGGYVFPKEVEILNALQRPIYILELTEDEGSAAGRVVWASDHLCEMLCVSPGELSGMELSRLGVECREGPQHEMYLHIRRMVQENGMALNNTMRQTLKLDEVGDPVPLLVRALPLKLKCLRHGDQAGGDLRVTKDVVLMDCTSAGQWTAPKPSETSCCVTGDGMISPSVTHDVSSLLQRAMTMMGSSPAKLTLFCADGGYVIAYNRPARDFYLARIESGVIGGSLDGKFDINTLLGTCVWSSHDEKEEFLNRFGVPPSKPGLATSPFH